MAKPKSMQRFDMLYLGSIAASAVSYFVGFEDTVQLTREQYAKQGMEMDPSGLITGTFIVGMLISLLLWWFTSKGSTVAKWILVVLFVIGLLATVYSFASGAAGPLTIATGISLLSLVLSVAAVYMLFQPDSKPWFEKEPAK